MRRCGSSHYRCRCTGVRYRHIVLVTRDANILSCGYTNTLHYYGTHEVHVRHLVVDNSPALTLPHHVGESLLAVASRFAQMFETSSYLQYRGSHARHDSGRAMSCRSRRRNVYCKRCHPPQRSLLCVQRRLQRAIEMNNFLT